MPSFMVYVIFLFFLCFFFSPISCILNNIFFPPDVTVELITSHYRYRQPRFIVSQISYFFKWKAGPSSSRKISAHFAAWWGPPCSVPECACTQFCEGHFSGLQYQIRYFIFITMVCLIKLLGLLLCFVVLF